MSATPSILALLQNMRQYQEQWVVPRAGLFLVSGQMSFQGVHSIRRLNDSINGLYPLVVGAGTNLHLVTPGNLSVPPVIDFAYSGNPLSLVPFRPDQSPVSWMYVADFQRMRKVRSDGTTHTMGIEPPLAAPTAQLGFPSFQIISDFEAVGAWTNGGTAGAISVVSRINATITKILYDAGASGWCSIVPSAFSDMLQAGMFVILGGATETCLVKDALQGIGQSTITSILYDTGSAGLCTIHCQAASIAGPNVGYTQSMSGAAVSHAIVNTKLSTVSSLRRPSPPRSGPRPVGPEPVRRPSTQPIGLQPNMIVRLNQGGGNDEFVRVLSVTLAKDGSASFRCSTLNAHVAGEGIKGVPSLRLYTVNTHTNGQTIVNNFFQSSLTVGTGFISLVAAFDLTTVGGRAIQETDYIHISIRMDHPEFLTEAKVFFDVDSATNDFAHNYFYATLRPHDTQQAVLGNQTAQLARQRTLSRLAVQNFNNPIRASKVAGPVTTGGDTAPGIGGKSNAPFAPGGTVGSSKQAKTGSTQWTEFKFLVSDLVRVGADSSRTLANVAVIRIQLQVTSPVVAGIDALWVGGSYGPDIGDLGSPYFYRYRGRSKITGAKSLAGPPMRSGIEPKREQVIAFMSQHPNPSVDTLDVYRWGGTLPDWYYAGSTPNSLSPAFADNFGDLDIANSPLLDLDTFQPFPTIDFPRSGTCNVVGTHVTNLGGDNFQTNWYPGSQININGIFYSLYSQPTDANNLELVETAGTLTAVPWTMAQATLLGVPLPALWGPYSEGTAAFLFACGDTFQPGVLFLTKGNDPDSAPDTLQIEVTSPNDPLMNGCMYNGRPYVWSSADLYYCQPNFSSYENFLTGTQVQLFVPKKVEGEKGLFGRWAFAVGPKMWYCANDGINESVGTGAKLITTPDDIGLLFPHDGQTGQPITLGSTTIQPPNVNLPGTWRLSYAEGHLYFDFQDVQSNHRTLVYNVQTGIWGLDVSTPGILTHYDDEGLQGMLTATAVFAGGADGQIYQMTGATDAGGPILSSLLMAQMSELATAYQMPIDGLLGLICPIGPPQLIVNVDGTDIPVSLAAGTAYKRVFTKLPGMKGKLLAFQLTGFQFSLNLRDCQFRIGAWGRAEQATQVNPFANMKRATQSKLS